MELTKDEQIERQWEKYFANRSDDEAKNAILTHYLYLVVGVVKRMKNFVPKDVQRKQSTSTGYSKQVNPLMRRDDKD